MIPITSLGLQQQVLFSDYPLWFHLILSLFSQCLSIQGSCLIAILLVKAWAEWYTYLVDVIEFVKHRLQFLLLHWIFVRGPFAIQVVIFLCEGLAASLRLRSYGANLLRLAKLSRKYWSFDMTRVLSLREELTFWVLCSLSLQSLILSPLISFGVRYYTNLE